MTLIYVGFAYLCLGLAFLILAIAPERVAGFYYQPRMLAAVHLVTLGWISCSILGVFYLICPLALRTMLRPGKLDYWALAFVTVGITGMVGHFWIDSYSGMVWSAATLWIGIAYVAYRGICAVRCAGIESGVKLHLILAFVNILLTGVVGMLIGLEKQQIHVLPGFLLHTVYAHAHLAALGWATMMVMGAGYRLFPMLLPAAMPRRRLWPSAVLLQSGLLVLLIALPMSWMWAVRAAALLIVGGLAAFFAHVVWMRRNPKRAPKGLEHPDFGVLHAMQGVVYLIVAAGLGVALAFGPPGAWKVQVATVYGVFGLLGFLAQMVIGVGARLLPMFAWMQFFVRSDFSQMPPSQYMMHVRGLQIAGFVFWTLGVPALAWGLAFDVIVLSRLAGAALFIATAFNGFNVFKIARHAYP